MILLIDTTEEKLGRKTAELMTEKGILDFELIDAGEMNISHCVGCNYCWLKSPGVCPIKDDYEPLLKKMKDADQIWLISDTSFGFVSYRTKNIVDRIMPLLVMHLQFVDGEMRHVMRYEKNADYGVIYTGEGNKGFLETWCNRVTKNLGTKSLGVYDENSIKEAAACM